VAALHPSDGRRADGSGVDAARRVALSRAAVPTAPSAIRSWRDHERETVGGRCVHEEVNRAEPGSANPDLSSEDRLVYTRQTAWERFVAFIRRIKVHDPATWKNSCLGLLPPVCEILLQAASGRSNGLGEERTLAALTVSLTWSM